MFFQAGDSARPNKSISSIQGTHQVAHRFTQVQVFSRLGTTAFSSPGNGRKGGAIAQGLVAVPRAQADRLAELAR